MSVLGTLVREWKRESSQKLVKIWQLWKKIMRKLALIPLRAREMKRVRLVSRYWWRALEDHRAWQLPADSDRQKNLLEDDQKFGDLN